jgi:hypothetical protein
MNIKEIITEEVVAEYWTTGRGTTKQGIDMGDMIKSQVKLVNTPLTQLNVRYSPFSNSAKIHEYYLYDKETDKCVGYFFVEMQNKKFDKVLKPGISAVIPHIGLARRVQGKGIASQIYTTFLRGGPWVFVTESHSNAAAALWDRIATGDIIEVYVDAKTEKRIENSKSVIDYRMIGPKDRFL